MCKFWITKQVPSYAKNKARIYHFRDIRKSEVNFILENDENKTIAVEIKSKSTIYQKDVANILKFAKNFNNKLFRAYVIYSGDEIMPLANDANLNIFLIPAKIIL